MSSESVVFFRSYRSCVFHESTQWLPQSYGVNATKFFSFYLPGFEFEEYSP